MSYQMTMSSVARAMLWRRPIELTAPAGPSSRFMVGEIIDCCTSRSAVNRESPAFSLSSWLPTVRTTPPRLHLRAGEFGGPHRSLYVRLDSASAWMYGLTGLPAERQTA